MKIALIAPPFIAVPPKNYGGTELFIHELATGLQKRGLEVLLYANGASTASVETRWLYEKEDWPIQGEVEGNLKSLAHAAWAVEDAVTLAKVDIIHLNNAPGLSFSRFIDTPFVYTIHHAYEAAFAEYYASLPRISYVAISDFQRKKLPMPEIHTIHHGIRPCCYSLHRGAREYLVFLGRVAPSKGTHLAIEIARRSGIPLKIAGEIQPLYRDYWEKRVKPSIDGALIEYLGEVGMKEKNELLGGARAMLFPIQWDEPFGLVMIEAMACGTPVLALPGGSVQEIIREGVSGHVRATVEELAQCARDLSMEPE